MNKNSRNNEKDNDPNVYGLRKVSFWEKYSVTCFPYRRRRRYSPYVHRSIDGGIIISNDVFGLTIRQFERMYKACLKRRKTKEQYILNLRYPDKSSHEYMEYLQDSTDCKKENMSWKRNNLKERYLYEHLVKIAGMEIDIRQRQKLFITQDMIQKAILKTAGRNLTELSSGSLAEGLDLRGSDIDIMVVIENIDILWDVRKTKHTEQRTTLVMEAENDHPGFTRLRLITGREGVSIFIQPGCFESTKTGLSLSAKSFVSNINKNTYNFKFSPHGPCLSFVNQSVDYAVSLRSKYLPYNAIPWASRYRLQWPPNFVIEKIIKNGCLLVPIGPSTLPDCNLLWRLSFSVAEKELVYSFNITQLLCYCLLKLTLKHVVNTIKDAESLLCSYFLKTALFWVSEEIDIDTFQLSKLYSCFSNCLSKLLLWVNNCYCPNYFIPEQNMFLGKISPDNNEILIHVLNSIKCDGIDGIINNLCIQNIGHDRLFRTQLERSCVSLDFLFYRTSHLNVGLFFGLSQCLKLLKFTRYLQTSTSSSFIVDACKYHHAQISQYTAQLLPTPTVTTETTEIYQIHKHFHRHLQDGIITDAVSGWLLYASFYYVTGQFNVTLQLVDYVRSRSSHDMVLTGCSNNNDMDINDYINHVHSTMTLKDRMRMAVVSSVKYVQNSSLIPKELKLEVKRHSIYIPSTVLSHFLRFVCYHHTGDMFNRQQALYYLIFTVKVHYHLITSTTLSNSLVILGVCFEMLGDKDTAYQCYDEALQCDGLCVLQLKQGNQKCCLRINFAHVFLIADIFNCPN